MKKSNTTDAVNIISCINNIYRLAKEKGIKIKDLENSIDKATGYLGRFKNGTIKSMPPADVLDKIAKELGVSVDYILNVKTEDCSYEDLTCSRFIQKLTEETYHRSLIWHYYSVNSEDDCQDEDIPQAIRNYYKELKKSYSRLSRETNYYLEKDLDHIGAYVADIDEMNGQVCLMCIDSSEYDNSQEYDNYSVNSNTWLFFVEKDRLNIIAVSSKSSASNIIEHSLKELFNAVALNHNNVKSVLIAKMNAYLDGK